MALCVTHSTNPTATFISAWRKALEVHERERLEALSLSHQTGPALSAECPPTRLQPALQSTQTFPSAGQQPSSTSKPASLRVLDGCLAAI